MSNAKSAFDIGHEIGLDAVDALAQAGVPLDQTHTAFAGLLTTVLGAIYHMAPNQTAAEQVIAFATETALENNARDGE